MSTAPDESGPASSRDLSALSLLDLIANQDMPLEPIHRYGQDEQEHEREDLSGPDAPLSYAAQALQLQHEEEGGAFWNQQHLNSSWRRWRGTVTQHDDFHPQLSLGRLLFFSYSATFRMCRQYGDRRGADGGRYGPLHFPRFPLL